MQETSGGFLFSASSMAVDPFSFPTSSCSSLLACPSSSWRSPSSSLSPPPSLSLLPHDHLPFSSFFDTPSLQCAGSQYLSSGASQMDFSAGGDFPSIAVSINHQHLHHYLTLRTENQLPSFLQNWKKVENYQVCLRWVLVSTQALVRSRHLVTWSLWQGGDMSTALKNIFLSLTYHSHQGSWIRCRHCRPFPCFLLQCGGEPHL